MTGYCGCVTSNNLEFPFEAPCPPQFYPIKSFIVHALGRGLSGQVVCDIARQCYDGYLVDKQDECVFVPDITNCWNTGLCPGIIGGVGAAIFVVVIIIAVCCCRRRRKGEPIKFTCCIPICACRLTRMNSKCSMDGNTHISTVRDDSSIEMNGCTGEVKEKRMNSVKL